MFAASSLVMMIALSRGTPPPPRWKRLSRCSVISADPPDRATMLLVLWPGTRSTRITSPPSASTMSWPTTFSRV